MHAGQSSNVDVNSPVVAAIVIAVLVCTPMPICIICLTVALCCTCRKYRHSRKQAAKENANVTSPQHTSSANAARNSLALEQTEHLYDYIICPVPAINNEEAVGHGSENLIQETDSDYAYIDSLSLEVTVVNESNTVFNLPTENVAYHDQGQLPPMEGQEDSEEYHYYY